MTKDITDVLIVDLDKQKIFQEDGNELNILPAAVRNWIKADIQNILKYSKLCDGSDFFYFWVVLISGIVANRFDFYLQKRKKT